MLKKLEENKYDFIFGSRYEKNAYSYDDNIITKIRNFFFTFLGNFFMKLKLTDILFTYILAKTEEIKSLQLSSDDYCLCIEIPFKILVLSIIDLLKFIFPFMASSVNSEI